MFNFKSMSVLLTVCALAVVCVLQAASAQSRLPIALDNPTAAALTNHTVRIEINATNAPGFDFTNNGDDLIAWNSDTSAMLDFFVESVDPVGQTAVVWIEVPSVPVSPPNTDIFLDYNRTDVVAPLSDASATFADQGFKYHTQQYSDADPGPETRAEGEAIFDFDTVAAPGSGYGCSTITTYSDGVAVVDNSTVYGSNMDIGFFMETMLIVPADARYEFRIGGDFGHGAELYLDGTTLEADWVNDLWWANSYANTTEVLQGDRLLTAGTHTLKVLGFERCCDGPAGFQYRYDSDGDGSLADETFTNLTTSSPGILLAAPSCPVTNTTLGPIATVPVTLSKFESTKIGPFLKVEWETADETFNAGFDIWTLSKRGTNQEELVQLNRRLVRSKRFDSLSTQKYQRKISLKQELDNVVISSVDINGTQEFFGPFDLGESYGADFKSQPIDWQRVQEDFASAMTQRGFVRVHNRWRKLRKGDTQDEGSAVAQIAVTERGIHRVSYEDLVAAGVDLRGSLRRNIAVTQDGKPLPRRIGGKSSLFGSGSFIDFVGVPARGTDSIYRAEGLYQISVDSSKARPVRWNRREATNPQTWSYQAKLIDNNTVHNIASPGDSPWLMDVMFRASRPATRNYTIQVEEHELLRDDINSVLDVGLVGVTNLPYQDIDGDGNYDPDHRAEIWLNGELVKVTTFEGQVTNKQSIELPAGMVKTGANTIQVRVAGSGYWFDAIGVDYVKLSYPVANSRSDFEYGIIGVNEKTGDGFMFESKSRRGKIAYTYRDDHNLMPLKIRRVKDKRGWFSVPFAAQGNARLFLGSASELKTPARIEQLEDAEDITLYDANLLIVSHPAFIGERLERYVTERNQQGVSAQIVSTRDIAANYGLDVPLHIAIKRFLEAADSQINYESVLIVGGHSYDYNQYVSDESINFIPTFYRPIGFSRFTPSDQPFVDFDNDGYPEKRVGRWPVRTQENLSNIINKSLAWASESDKRSADGHQLLMMADRVTNLPFIDDIDRQLSLLKQTSLTWSQAQKLYLDELDDDPSIPSESFNETVQQRVRDAIDGGASWLLYNGHGSPATWSATNLLSSESVANLGNNGAPVLITSLGCYTTYYENPSHNSLAHQLLFSGTNGAVAVHGPAIVGAYDSQRRLAELIMIHSSKQTSIGEAIYKGMRALPLNHANAILNWALLSDPTLPIQ